jgi:hypothetical protein
MAKFEIAVYKSLQPGGIKATYDVTDNLEADIAAAGADRVHRVFVKDLIYHSVLTSLRNELSEAVEEFAKANGTAFEWLTEKRTVNGKETTVIIEDNEDYVRRAVARGIVNIEWLQTKLQDLADDAENAFALFAKEPERKPRAPKKLPKDIQLAVEQYTTEGLLDNVAAALSAKLGRTVEASPEAVGWAIKEHKDKIAAAAAAQAAADLKSLIGNN